jgi:hypothetical protein
MLQPSCAFLRTSILLALVASATAQDFGPPQVLTSTLSSATSIAAFDVDGDGRADVVSAGKSQLQWQENLGGGQFGAPTLIAPWSGMAPRSLQGADVDGDGDADLIASDTLRFVWFENEGGGSFGPLQIVGTGGVLQGAGTCLHAGDLNGDGRPDVLGGTHFPGELLWFENLGAGSFGPMQIISDSVDGITSVVAADLDGDGDRDVLASSSKDGWSVWTSSITWFENLGSGSFGPAQVISVFADGASCVDAADLDGDGDLDVLSSSWDDDKIAWYENLGPGWFGSELVISTAADMALAVATGDLDGDGDPDVLSASSGDDKLAWYENLGGGAFGAEVVLPGSADGACAVLAADLNGDGALDVLSAAAGADTVAWHANQSGADCNRNGRLDGQEIADDPSLDWNGDGILDECVPANYCTTAVNSSGARAVIGASGSPCITDDALTLEAWDLPPYRYAYFLMSEGSAFHPGFGGGSGNLCLGSPLIHFNSRSDGGAVLNSGSQGRVSFTPDMTSLPGGVVFQPGDAWYFQLWFRDVGASGSTSNTTDGIEVMFR